MDHALIPAAAGFLLAVTFAAGDVPHPFSVPEDMSAYLGDPDRGPEPREQHRKGRYQLPLPEVTVNEGHPIRDYGHFRLNQTVLNDLDRSRPGFVIPRKAFDAEQAMEHYTAHDWGDGERLRFSFAAPPTAGERPEGGWPLVVIAPGMGGLGEKDLRSQVRRGGTALMWTSRHFREHYPAYVLALHPQQRPHEYHVHKDKPTEVTTTAVLDAYIEAIEAAIQAHPDIDRRRIYVTGHSMGGAATWLMMLKRPDLFAAAAPAAGTALFKPEQVQRIVRGGTPIWMMMGNDDPWSGSQYYIAGYLALNRAGAENVRFWEVQDVGHSGAFLRLLPVIDWMYAQRRPPR